MKLLFSFTILICVGCATVSDQIVADAIYDAQSKIKAAKDAEAETIVPDEISEAERQVDRAGELLTDRKRREAYRLAQRAVLKAESAHALTEAVRIETLAHEAELELNEKLKTLEANRNALDHAESELKQLKNQGESE